MRTQTTKQAANREAKQTAKTGRQMDFLESVAVLKKYGIKVPRYAIIKSAPQLAKVSGSIGYPQAMKIVSEDVIHKTDAGGVIISIRSPSESIKAYSTIIRNIKKKHPGAKIDGVLVQKMFGGTEIIIGAKKDPQFGPVVIFGLGGIFVEILKDISMRVAPITSAVAAEMIDEIKSSALLKGARGRKPADTKAIANIISKISKLAAKETRIREIDLNPVMVDGKSLNIVDIRIITD